MRFLDELKAFALKGNAVDMALGILVGSAFNRVVNSIVNDLCLPLVEALVTGVELNTLEIPLKTTMVAGVPKVTASLKYGAFLNALLEFALIALSGFFAVKWMNRLRSVRLEELQSQVKALVASAEQIKTTGIAELKREIDKLLD